MNTRMVLRSPGPGAVRAALVAAAENFRKVHDMVWQCWDIAGHHQREIARLGRVDHLDRETQDALRVEISARLEHVRSIAPKRGRGLSD